MNGKALVTNESHPTWRRCPPVVVREDLAITDVINRDPAEAMAGKVAALDRQPRMG